MLVTLLLPIVVPYGNPWTIYNPRIHYLRKAEFFRWIESVANKNKKYQHVPLLFAEGIKKHENILIVGEKATQTNFVPSSGGV
jgi:hypothetical protein